MGYNNFSYQNKTTRIILFMDLRDSTNIQLNFENGVYSSDENDPYNKFTYENFISDVHETTYAEFYLSHENTFAEIYGDGIMAVFPEDNSKYILENIYRLTDRMRRYNDSLKEKPVRPEINIGFGITLGKVSFAHYPFDRRAHALGSAIHEASRIESLSKRYDARVLISRQFLDYIQYYVNTDSRFSYRFIDRLVLYGFRGPITLYELLLDNDPRFEVKKKSVEPYNHAYTMYCKRDWKRARDIFYNIYSEYGLGTGSVMANRCDRLSRNEPEGEWQGIWDSSKK